MTTLYIISYFLVGCIFDRAFPSDTVLGRLSVVLTWPVGLYVLCLYLADQSAKKRAKELKDQ